MTAKTIGTGNKEVTIVSKQASIVDTFTRGVRTAEMQAAAAGIADNLNRDFTYDGDYEEQFAWFDGGTYVEYTGGSLTPDHPDFEGVEYIMLEFGGPWMYYYPSTREVLVQHWGRCGVARITEEAAAVLLEVCKELFWC